VDTECAEERIIGGKLQPAMGYDLRVFGRFANQARALGIEYICDEWARHGHRATFYVEALGARSFGKAGLREACDIIRTRAHDVQVHAHPCQEDAFWHTSGRAEPLADDMSAHDRAGQAAILQRCIANLGECGVPIDSLVSFRAGNFGANNQTWEAIADAGLKISSSYNLGYRHKSVFTWPRAESGLFRPNEHVWELPMTVFSQRFAGVRHLQVTACAIGEIVNTLEWCHRHGIDDVMMLTHSFEYLHIDSIPGRTGRPNSVAQHRLAALGVFLRENADRFEVLTVAGLAKRLATLNCTSADPPQLPQGSSLQRGFRLVEQLYQRAQRRLPLP
jgi:hypothetical protein